MEKIILPIKTKMAAWWMIIIGGIFLITAFLSGLMLIIFFSSVTEGGLMWDYGQQKVLILLLLGTSLSGIFFVFLPGLFLLQRKKRACKFAVIILSIGLMGLGVLFFYPVLAENKFPPPSLFGIPFIILLIPFILLVLDHKNFLKTVS